VFLSGEHVKVTHSFQALVTDNTGPRVLTTSRHERAICCAGIHESHSVATQNMPFECLAICNAGAVRLRIKCAFSAFRKLAKGKQVSIMRNSDGVNFRLAEPFDHPLRVYRGAGKKVPFSTCRLKRLIVNILSATLDAPRTGCMIGRARWTDLQSLRHSVHIASFQRKCCPFPGNSWWPRRTSREASRYKRLQSILDFLFAIVITESPYANQSSRIPSTKISALGGWLQRARRR
jgi:hypothetical protein